MSEIQPPISLSEQYPRWLIVGSPAELFLTVVLVPDGVLPSSLPLNLPEYRIEVDC